MKIGIMASTFHQEGYGRYGDKTYEKIRELGFDSSDFDACETDLDFYTLPQSESDKLILKEKELAKKAGIEIDQVHGLGVIPRAIWKNKTALNGLKKCLFLFALRLCLAVSIG